MAIDMNIEHLIGYVKTLFAAKGIHSSWEHLGNISAGVKNLMHLKKRVSYDIETAYQTREHKTPDTTTELTWRVVKCLRDTQLLLFQKGRAESKTAKAIPDLRLKGDRHLESSSVATFSRKISQWRAGGPFGEEEDEIRTVSAQDYTFEHSTTTLLSCI